VATEGSIGGEGSSRLKKLQVDGFQLFSLGAVTHYGGKKGGEKCRLQRDGNYLKSVLEGGKGVGCFWGANNSGNCVMLGQGWELLCCPGF